MSRDTGDDADEPLLDRSSMLGKVTAGALGLAALSAVSGSASAQDDCDADVYCSRGYRWVEVCCDGDCDTNWVGYC